MAVLQTAREYRDQLVTSDILLEALLQLGIRFVHRSQEMALVGVLKVT